jgi:pimeloyl-ACP methyl ester carboxylesterase
MPKFNQQLELPDGRRLGYDKHGPTEGRPVFYFHGSPSSRLEIMLFTNEKLLQSLKIHLIAVDRPGMGLSDYQADRSLLDWPEDVLELADKVNIDLFAILAYSLGGPYGAACAYAIPKRLSKVGIVSGAALFTEPELAESINEGTRRYLNLPREKPWAARVFMWMLGAMARLAPKRFLASANSLLPEPDRQVVSDPDFQKGFLAMFREALRQGVRGAQHESLLAITDWGFRPEHIQAPVLIRHGEVDVNVPIAMARHLANAIPNSQAKFYPNEGHLSLFKKHAKEILLDLVD